MVQTSISYVPSKLIERILGRVKQVQRGIYENVAARTIRIARIKNYIERAEVIRWGRIMEVLFAARIAGYV